MNTKEMELQKIAESTGSTQTALSNEQRDEYLHTALEAGKLSLGNGSETARCYNIVKNILKSSGSENYVATVISKSIFASLDGKTEIATAERAGTNLNRICVANDISHAVADGKLGLKEAREKLSVLSQTKLYNFVLRLLAYVVAMVATPIFLNCTIVDCAAATVCGVIMAFVDALFRRIRIHTFASIFTQTLIMVICGGLSVIFSRGYVSLYAVVVAAIMPMFPGLALTNAVRDTLQGDYVSGAGRLMEAFMSALAISLGVAVGLVVSVLATGTQFEQLFDTPFGVITDTPYLFWIYAAAALFYSAGYCILFEVPPKFIIWNALVGCAGKTLCMYINYHTDSEVWGTFLATLVVALLAQIFARIFKAPATPFLIAGIMALVPGRSLYASISTIIDGAYAEGSTELLRTLMIAGAIALAIFLVDTIFLTAHRIKNRKIMKQ